MSESSASRWRVRFSPLGIVGGLIGAIGLLVLLQQSGSVFPTIGVIIVAGVLGLIVGIVLPSLAQVITTRRQRPTG